MSDFQFMRDSGKVKCPCGKLHDPLSSRVSCPKCLGRPDWPFRPVLPGDLAVCSRGTLGVVTSVAIDSPAVGVQLSPRQKGQPSWDPEGPLAVLDVDVWWLIAQSPRHWNSFSGTYLHLPEHILPGWHAQLEYVEAREVRWIREHVLTADHLRAMREHRQLEEKQVEQAR